MKKQTQQTTQRFFKVIKLDTNHEWYVDIMTEHLSIMCELEEETTNSYVLTRNGENYYHFPKDWCIEFHANGRKVRTDKGGSRVKKTKEPELPFIGVMCRIVNDQVTEIAKEVELNHSNVDHPQHYGGKDNPYEAIKVIEATMTPEEFKGFLKGNVIKYSLRFDKKNGAEDLSKLSWYANRLADFLTNSKN